MESACQVEELRHELIIVKQAAEEENKELNSKLNDLHQACEKNNGEIEVLKVQLNRELETARKINTDKVKLENIICTSQYNSDVDGIGYTGKSSKASNFYNKFVKATHSGHGFKGDCSNKQYSPHYHPSLFEQVEEGYYRKPQKNKFVLSVTTVVFVVISAQDVIG